MHRFFVPDVRVGDQVPLDEKEWAHATRVLRLQPGTDIQVVTRAGRYAAVLQADGGALISRELPSASAHTRITLFQGLPKGEKMEWIVQKATELGVAEIVPVAMERCIVKYNGPDGSKKSKRWNRIAQEAAKQCGRGDMLTVSEPMGFDKALNRAKDFFQVLVPWEETSQGDLRTLAPQCAGQNVALFIGSEGGITKKEMEALMAVGARTVTLGPRILRTETAGIAAISAFMCLCGEWEGMER